MPELPEVEALADYLRQHAVDRTIGRVDVVAFSVLKTFEPPINVLHGLTVTGAERWGKYLGLRAGELILITHLSRAGWLRWSDKLAALGPDALGLSVDDLGELLAGNTGRIKSVITDQKVIAGIGNAYSDEILHVAKISPFATAGKIADGQLAALHDAMVSVLTDAVTRSVGQQAATLKGEKRSGLRVHARTGLPCPVCGDTVREVSFADKSFQYCPTCQTGGKVLADRRMSRLLK
jgi:formamidopyrimidine-DNA glycosylase